MTGILSRGIEIFSQLFSAYANNNIGLLSKTFVYKLRTDFTLSYNMNVVHFQKLLLVEITKSHPEVSYINYHSYHSSGFTFRLILMYKVKWFTWINEEFPSFERVLTFHNNQHVAQCQMRCI